LQERPEFLEVPVPDEPLPRSNDTVAFKEWIIGGALAVVNGWLLARVECGSMALHKPFTCPRSQTRRD
jgi:hypothetical protein